MILLAFHRCPRPRSSAQSVEEKFNEGKEELGNHRRGGQRDEIAQPWPPGAHDNPSGMRLTALMISKGIADSSVPMSLLAEHPNVQFNYYRPGIGTCEAEMH